MEINFVLRRREKILSIEKDIVFNIIIDINNYINENKELKFDKEIELLIEKYFKNEKNYEKYNRGKNCGNSKKL